MQRAIYSTLRNSVAGGSLRSQAIFRPIILVPRVNQVFGTRFASSDASKQSEHEQKSDTSASEESDDKKSDTENVGRENSEMEELKSKLNQKDKDLADMKNLYAKAVADFRNLQESTKKDMEKAKNFALQKFAKDLLESLDNFGLALNAVSEDTLKSNSEVKNLYDGVGMTRDVFEKTLNRHGIEKIDPIGEQFDPNKHEASFEVPQPDKEPGTVFHVQQLGYTLNDRVLRPAKVGLVKSAEE